MERKRGKNIQQTHKQKKNGQTKPHDKWRKPHKTDKNTHKNKRTEEQKKQKGIKPGNIN